MNSPPKVRICIPVCERTVAALEQAMAAASEVGGLIEVRLDCLDPLELEAALAVARLLERSGYDLIFTFRPAEQGGRHPLDQETRSKFWASGNLASCKSLLDIELDLVEQFNSSNDPAHAVLDWTRVICSYHDFISVPTNLDQIYERMANTPARILKIAVRADDANDCLPVFRLLERARAEGREMIAISMGPAGIATRILGLSRGAFLTYAAFENDTATAPGQVSVSELREVYRIEKIDQHTQIFGLIGLSISHSISPRIHNAAFEAMAMNGVYIPFEVRDLDSFFKRTIHPRTREIDWDVRGLSVTAPHKTSVMDYLDWLEPSAKEIGAVNTVVVDDEKLRGYNTDAKALTQSLIEKLGSLNQARVAVIGAGGVASAAAYGLNQQGVVTTVFARDTNRAKVLAKSFGANYESLDRANFDGFDAVINATPLGTVGQFESETPATAAQLAGARLAYDLVYNPTETRFLREAREAGCDTLGGLSMLVAQAAAQFSLWAGTEAPERVMHEAAERALNKNERTL